MPKLDDEIDRLYQLPLSEFTKARDELARRFEKDRAAIRSLEKPNIPAWAVNQLFWRDRRAYDSLVAASSKLRATQLASLKGKSTDIEAVESRHARLRRAAAERIRGILSAAGDALSSSTFDAINETLDALPTDGRPGRLVRPLKPMGFQGLAGLLKGGKVALRQAEVVPFRKKPGPDPERLKREAEERARRERRRLEQSLHQAQEAERAAELAHEKSRKTLEAAIAKRAALEAQSNDVR